MRKEDFMAQRGRPNQGITMLWRDTHILHEYEQLRKTGEKNSAAERGVVLRLREATPPIYTSVSEVKRCLARHRPRHSSYGITVTKPDPSNRALTLGLPVKGVLLAAWGPRTVYPRHNAAEVALTCEEPGNRTRGPVSRE